MWRPVAFAAALAAALHLPLDAAAQTIDTAPARLVMSRPIHLDVLVRGAQAGVLPAHCVEAELRVGETRLGSSQLRISTRADGDLTRLTLQHPDPLGEPIVEARIALRCGADLVREFAILSEPPGAAPTNASTASATPAPLVHTRAHPPHPPISPTSAMPPVRPRTASARPQPPAEPPAPLRPATFTSAGVPAAVEPVRLTLPAAATTPLVMPMLASPINAELLNQIQHLQRQQDQSATAINLLLVRLEQQERSRWMQLLSLLGSVALTLLASRLLPQVWLGWQQRRRTTQAPAATESADPAWFGARTSRLATPEYTAPISAEPPAGASPTAIDLPPLALTASPADSTPRRQQWPNADFGEPSLETPDSQLLDKLDQLVEQGYPGACALALEQTLLLQPGKPAALLLRLLDIYRRLRQPANSERVEAQLEALYNVSIPLPGTLAAGSTAQDTSWHAPLTRLWQAPDRHASLGRWLLPTAQQERLPLDAFRELVWLHQFSAGLDA